MAGAGGGVEDAVRDDGGAGDEEVAHAVGGAVHVGEAGAVLQGGEVEDDDVGVGAGLEAAFGGHGGGAGFQDLRGDEGAFPDGFRQRDGLAVADPVADEAGEGAGRAGVGGGFGGQGPGVAGVGGAVRHGPGHGVRGDGAVGEEDGDVEQVLVVGGFEVEEVPQDEGGGLLSLAGEEFGAAAEAGAVGDALDGVVAGAAAGFELGVREEGGGEDGGAGAVGVGFDGDGQALGLRLGDEAGAAFDVGFARAVEVADVHVGAGGAGVADEADVGFGGAFGVDAGHVGDVGEGGNGAVGGELAHRGEFLDAGAGGVGVEDADADAAFVEAVGEAGEDAGEFGVGGDVFDPAAVAHGAAEGFEGGFFVGAGHGADAGKGPVGGGAVVQHTAVLGLAVVPGGDGHDAGFEVEGGGDAVEGLHAVGGDGLAVGVKVDKAGGDDEAGGVNLAVGAAEVGADGGDAAAFDDHVAHGSRGGRRGR